MVPVPVQWSPVTGQNFWSETAPGQAANPNQNASAAGSWMANSNHGWTDQNTNQTGRHLDPIGQDLTTPVYNPDGYQTQQQVEIFTYFFMLLC